eukprot:EW704509.1.p4 GENE.EW704509.1~~EW704509.1.p4  ORF type:complete len:64 (-),score=7.55 EW704509.1:155-346(-)
MERTNERTRAAELTNVAIGGLAQRRRARRHEGAEKDRCCRHRTESVDRTEDTQTQRRSAVVTV